MSSIIFFFITLIIALAMIARKIWKLRTGQIVAGSYEEADWTDISIEAIRSRIIELTKFGIHHFVLFILKLWIVTSNWVKNTDQKIKEKLMHMLHKNAHYPAGGKPSNFIKHIRKHKDEIVRSIQNEAGEA